MMRDNTTVEDNEMDNKTIRMRCENCERVTTFELKSEFMVPAPKSEVTVPTPIWESSTSTQPSRMTHVGTEYWVWRVSLCLTCLTPTLQWDEQVVIESQGPLMGSAKVLYPVSRTGLDNVPEAIEKEYRAALKYLTSDPNACAVYIGRALDRVCRQENIKGKRLIDKLTNLVTEKKLSEQLGTMVDQLRKFRNIGAHADEEAEVTAEDAPVMLDFLEALLEYLYVAPTKIANVQARLKKTT